MRTRRDVIIRGLGLAAGGLALRVATAQAAAAPVPSDAELIQALCGTELLVAFVYERILRADQLRPSTTRLTRQLLAHERSHANALKLRLPALGVSSVPRGPRSDEEAEQALRSHHTELQLARRRSDPQWIGVMLDIEDALERDYHMAISYLRSPALLQLSAQILGSEAQHSALLGGLLNPHNPARALPDKFVNGE